MGAPNIKELEQRLDVARRLVERAGSACRDKGGHPPPGGVARIAML